MTGSSRGERSQTTAGIYKIIQPNEYRYKKKLATSKYSRRVLSGKPKKQNM
jgi:hypothetical protein